MSKRKRKNPRDDVQSLLFDRDQWHANQAAQWAYEHGFIRGHRVTVERFPAKWHIRVKSPDSFSRLRTVDFKHGIEARIGFR